MGLCQLFPLKRNEYKSREQIQVIQDKKLRKLLYYAYDHSQYYREVFTGHGISRKQIGSLPLSAFPTIDKKIVMEHFDEIVTVPDIRQAELLRFDMEISSKDKLFHGKYHVVHSSGSTGIPRYFVYDASAWEQMLCGIIRGALWGMSIPQVIRLLAGRPHILYIAATDGRYGGALAIADGIYNLHAEQRFLDVETPIQEWIQTVQEFEPDIIIGYPSAIKILGEMMEQESTDIPVKRVITCGEPLHAGLRTFLEKAFQTDVINFYGASESLALGVEGAAGDGIYLFDDLNVVEVVDGEMFLTCLYNYTQPLIRYHITDQLQIQEERTGNKSGFTKADVVASRAEDILWFEKEDGKKEFVHPLSIEGFCIDGLRDYQFRQTSPYSFEILAEVPEQTAQKEVRVKILQQMREVLAEKGLDGIDFFVRFVEEILPDSVTGKKQLIVKEQKMEECVMREKIINQQYDEERALYHLQHADLEKCSFVGPADGESSLKEARDIGLKGCQFSLRYPLWHVDGFQMEQSDMDEKTRAAIWYAKDGSITDSYLGGIKAVRECAGIHLKGCHVVSEEFGWKSRDIVMEDTEITSEYLFMDSRDVRLRNVKMKGKYSFQYMENLEITDSELDTKDAFWHSKNVTVRNSIVKGEYLGWFSEGLTLIHCKIIGTQPLCYCKNLKLVDCTMEHTDLAFEYSEVEADIQGHVDSIKNPKSGKIVVDSVGEIVQEDAVMECVGEIVIREQKKQKTAC